MMQKGDNPYDILDVPQNCDYLILKKAYRKFALATHPERKAGDATRFAKIANAYELLGDPSSRHNYDLQQRFRDRSRPNNAGYDPDAPDFPYDISEQYDPSQPDQTLVPNNTLQAHHRDEDHDMSERREVGEIVGTSSWVTYTVMEKGQPVTKRRATKVYSRSPRKGAPLPKAISHTFQIDPFTMFQEEFPEGWKPHAKMRRSSSADPKKKKSNSSDNESVGSRSRRKSKKKSTEAAATEPEIATPSKVRRSKRRGSCASDGKGGISSSNHAPSTDDNMSSPKSGNMSSPKSGGFTGNHEGDSEHSEVITHSGSKKVNVSLTSPSSNIIFSPAQKKKMLALSAATTPKSKISGIQPISLSDFVSSMNPGYLDDSEPSLHAPDDDDDQAGNAEETTPSSTRRQSLKSSNHDHDSNHHNVEAVTHSGSKKVNVSLTSPYSHLIFSPAQKKKMKALSAATTPKSKTSGIQPLSLSDFVSRIHPGNLDDNEPSSRSPDHNEMVDHSESAGSAHATSANPKPQIQDPADNQSVGSKATKKKTSSETKKAKSTSKTKKLKKKNSHSPKDLNGSLQALTLEQGMASIMQGDFADSESSLHSGKDKAATRLGSKTEMGSLELNTGSVGGKSKKKKKKQKPTVPKTKKKSRSKSPLDESGSSLKAGDWAGSESSLREDEAVVVQQSGNQHDHSPSNNSSHSSFSRSSSFTSPRPRIKYHRINHTNEKANPQNGKRIIRPLPPDYNSDSDSDEDNDDSDDDDRGNNEPSPSKAKNMVLPLPPDYDSDSEDDTSSDDDDGDDVYFGDRPSNAASLVTTRNRATLPSPKADPVRFVYKNGKRVVLRPSTSVARGSEILSPITTKRDASGSTTNETVGRSKGNRSEKRIIFRNGKKVVLPPDTNEN